MHKELRSTLTKYLEDRVANGDQEAFALLHQVTQSPRQGPKVGSKYKINPNSFDVV